MNTIVRLGAIAALAAGTLAACHHAKTPTDAELTNLLRSPAAQPNDPAARIDPGAVDCLRAWSGDADLTKPLPPVAASDAAKKACRQRLDTWIADATRNPEKLAFEDVSAPPAVRQAIALLQQHRATAPLPMAGDRPPPAMMMRQNQTPAAEAPKEPVDLTATRARVDELERLCKQAKDAAAAGSTAPITRYASMCENRIALLRNRIDQLVANGGGTSREAEMLNNNVQQMLTFGRRLSGANGPTAPAQPAKPGH